MRVRRSLPGLAAVAASRGALVAAALTLPALVALPQQAAAASPDVVISQVYGGGGNTDAPYASDFVELYNRGGAAVNVTGWSVQYASASGTTWSSKITLSGTVQPGRYYLARGASGSVGAALPAPDATGTVNLSATSGKVALVTSTTSLSCGSNCDSAPGVRDFVGYGSANDAEGSPASDIANATSDLRAGGGTTDTDANAADFVETSPVPRNSTVSNPGPASVRARDIQERAHLSPLNGRSVSGVTGVVTATRSNGFWMQDPAPDSAPSTSEGIFVFTSSAPTVNVADSVTVGGTVVEYRAGGTSGTTNLTVTEIAVPSVTVTGSGAALPAATLVGSGGRVPPSAVIDDDANGDVERSGTYSATVDGIDFWESMEGMRVRLDNAAVVGPRSTFNELPVVPAGSGVRTSRGGIAIGATDFNPERVILDDGLAAVPSAQVGDTLSGSTTGVLDYSFGNFKLLPTSTPTVSSGNLSAETTTPQGAGQLAVGTFNVENLDPADPQSKFDALADTIVTNLRSPDLLVLEEVQDNDGPTNSTTVAADQTLNELASAVSAAGGPAYSWRQISPVDDQDGGEPGGNIRVAFLYRTDRGLAFVDRPGGTATNATSVTGSGASTALTYSPGRIQPTNSAWASSRKPLAGEFTWNGQRLFVVANHFNSKGGDDPLFGRFQPPSRSSESKRHSQANLVRGFVDSLLAADTNANVVVAGDINDFEFSQTADILVGTGGQAMTDLPRTLAQAERYTYVYEGNSQVLDHILLSRTLSTYAYDIVHVNAEFTTQVSDHDPQVARLTF